MTAIADFIALDSVARALEILSKLRDTVAALSIMPQRGRIVPELQAQGILSYHEIIHAPWRIIYRIAEGNVYILAVIDARRNLEDILLERFTR